jgi:hypothetical protein
MAQRSDSITLFGFHSGETDFASAYARLSQAHRDVIDKLSKIIYNVNQEPTASCSIFIHGLSDRDDTAGLTPEQRRDSESAASFARAISLENFLLAAVNVFLVAFGNPAATSWQDLTGVFVHSTGIGASQLTFKTPQNETQRRHNRRTNIIVDTVNMSIIEGTDPTILDAS